MPGVQDTVTTAPAAGMPGMQYDSEKIDVVSLVASEDIPFGAYVKCGEGVCSLPAVSGDLANGGVALISATKPSGGSAYGPQGYKAGDPVSVIRKGRVWVKAEQAIAAGAAPFIRFAGAGNGKGSLRSDADTANAATPKGVSVFRGANTVNANVVLDLNLPNG